MNEEKKLQEQELRETENNQETETVKTSGEMSPTWAHDCIEDLDDWIESQGIYLRQ